MKCYICNAEIHNIKFDEHGKTLPCNECLEVVKDMNRKPDPYLDENGIPIINPDDIEILPDDFDDVFYDEGIRVEREACDLD